ncbi:tetratricopeptide repeat protein [Actinomyces bouchesdurhonensis]|uniref:tetratricopeptide repeat protein n=1 Tax=Actinomyces bouchesdurhonensis TaxID=1852361 RepID=UPI0023F24052|nr:tetratricopeptide repeat protein [Actinomyces bouchesdurhonensis]
MVDPVVVTLVSVAVAFTKTLLRSTNNNLGAEIVGDTAGPLAEISQLVLGRKGSQKQVERAINRDLAKRMRNMHERCYREGIDPDRLVNPCAEVEAVLNTIGDHKWMLEQAVHDPDALRTDFKKRALKQRAQVDERLVPYFDELIKAVVEQYIDYAERSPNYLHVAAKRSLKNDKESREADAKILDAVDDVRHMVGKFASSDSKPSRVFFGSRPDVVAGERFVERDEQKHLNELIVDPTIQRTVLVGMRGCGKTQLAASLAKQCEDANWNLVAWINAVSRESIENDLVELAKQLQIDTSDLDNQGQIVRRCLGNLRNAPAANRLILFDNVEDIGHLTELIPSSDGMRVVATTTNKVGWEDQGWNSIKVGVFDRSESIDYLLTVTRCDDHDAADALAQRLGDLPLALAQAAASARNKDLSLTRYLDRLDSYRSERVIRPVPGDYYADDVATALCMAIEDALENLEDGTKQAALRQLGALALLAESGVPTRWLDPTIEQQDDRELQGAHQAEDEDAHDALTELIHRSIVHQSADKATTMLHRFQAQVLRDSWSEEEREQACESAAALLGSVDIDRFRADYSDARFQETRNLIEHLRAFGAQDCFLHLRDYRHITIALCHAFDYARDLGLVPEVFALKESVNTLHEQVGDSRETLSLLAQLAYAHMYMSDYPTAICLYKQVLRTREQILEPNHRDILSTRNDLAYAYYWEGDTGKAIDLFEQVLEDRTRILSSDHEDTLMTGSYLALAYADDGQLERAIALGEQVVKDRDRVLQPDHKHTLVTRNNLADAYKSVGRLTDAIKMYEYVLEARIRTLGSTHHHTRITRNDLAQTYEQAGDLPKAISMYEDLHNDYIRIYGADHESTIEVRDRLEAAKRELEQQEEDSATE